MEGKREEKNEEEELVDDEIFDPEDELYKLSLREEGI